MNFLTASRHACVSLLILNSSLVFAENCTRDQAFNKMMAISKASQERMTATMGSAPGNSQMIEAAELAKEISMVGAILGQSKYNEACGYYNEIAAKYGIDLKESAKGMKTMADLAKDGGKGKHGKCSQADASKKVMSITNKIQDLMATGEDLADVQKAFFNEVEANSALIYTDPSAYCDKLDNFVKANSLVLD